MQHVVYLCTQSGRVGKALHTCTIFEMKNFLFFIFLVMGGGILWVGGGGCCLLYKREGGYGWCLSFFQEKGVGVGRWELGGAFVARLKGKGWLGLGLGVEDIRNVLQKKCSRDVLTVQYIGLYLGVELNVPTELATTLDETLNLGCKLNVGFLPLA